MSLTRGGEWVLIRFSRTNAFSIVFSFNSVPNTSNGSPGVVQPQQQQHFCTVEVGIARHSGETAPKLVESPAPLRSGISTTPSGGGTAVVPSAIQITVTRMLLLVSTVFIILNLPFYLSRIYLHAYANTIPHDSFVSNPI